MALHKRRCIIVALRKESVDRNDPLETLVILPKESLSARRAWIDIPPSCGRIPVSMSLSARRAWIEMILSYERLLKEQSLSARRAWIEILSQQRIE